MAYVPGQQFTLDEFNALTAFNYDLANANLPESVFTVPNPYGGYQQTNRYVNYSSLRSYLDQPKNKQILDYFGFDIIPNNAYASVLGPGQVEWRVTRGPGYYSATDGASGFYGVGQFLAQGLGVPVNEGFRYSFANPKTSSLDQYRDSIFTGFSVRPPSPPRGNIFDSVLSSPFAPQNFLNIFSGSKSLTNILGSDDNAPKFFEAALTPAPQNYTNIGIKAGVDVVSAVGLGYGVEGASVGLANYSAASAPLSANVAGPVAPGFFDTLLSGNFTGAYQILANPLAAGIQATNAPLIAQTGFGEVLKEGISLILKTLGDFGKGVGNLFSGNYVGALKDFNIVNSSGSASPSTPNLYGSYGPSSGGGGGGSGLGIASNTGQNQSSSLVYPVVGLAAIILLLIFVRKK